MDSKASAEERQGFAQRLASALSDANCPATPTAFVREFNVRANGATVTVHAARKWLVGEAIPTQEKVHVLARWLGVSTEWLRFGEDGKGALAPLAFESNELRLLNDIRTLEPRDKNIVHELVGAMIRQRRT